MKVKVNEGCAGRYLWALVMVCMTFLFTTFLKKKESAAIEKGNADIKIKFIVTVRILKDFFLKIGLKTLYNYQILAVILF